MKTITIALVLVALVVVTPALAATSPQEFVRTCSGEWSHEKYGKGPLTVSVTKVQNDKASGTVEGTMADGRSNSRPAKFTGQFEDRDGVTYLVFGVYNAAQVYITYELTLNGSGGFTGRSTGRITAELTLDKCS